MPELSRRHLLAGAASTVAVAAMPAVATAAVASVASSGPLADGRSLLAGAFDPPATLGSDGDFYADAVTGDMWHRSRGRWKKIFDYAESESARA